MAIYPWRAIEHCLSTVSCYFRWRHVARYLFEPTCCGIALEDGNVLVVRRADPDGLHVLLVGVLPVTVPKQLITLGLERCSGLRAPLASPIKTQRQNHASASYLPYIIA